MHDGLIKTKGIFGRKSNLSPVIPIPTNILGKCITAQQREHLRRLKGVQCIILDVTLLHDDCTSFDVAVDAFRLELVICDLRVPPARVMFLSGTHPV